MAGVDVSSKKDHRIRMIIVLFMVALVSVVYYLTVPRHVYYHTLFRDLYFLPLILSGFWFGLGGALIVAAIITVICLPYLFLNWQGFSPLDFSRILEIVLFNVIGLVLGYVSNKEKASQRALRESENLAAMGTALAAVAHDMKTPLTAIGGLTRTVHRKLKEDDEGREKLAAVIKESDRLEGMVKDMLNFSRPLKLNLTEGDLNEVVRESLVVLEPQAKKKRVSVETDLSESLPHVDFDAPRIKQVLINLVVNAVQASPEGEKVLVRTHRKGDRVHLEVADHGPGVPDEVREKIFLPFFSTKGEGTGLGLPIALKILDAHGGTLEVLQTREKGATFQMSVPLKRPSGPRELPACRVPV